MCLMPYANNKDADQSRHPRSLISTFVVHCLDSMICTLALSKVSMILASFCSSAGWFESYLVENPRRPIFVWCGSIIEVSAYLNLSLRTDFGQTERAVWSGSAVFAVSIFWTHFSSVKLHCSGIRIITAILSGDFYGKSHTYSYSSFFCPNVYSRCLGQRKQFVWTTTSSSSPTLDKQIHLQFMCQDIYGQVETTDTL